MNRANAVTVVRILLVPLFVWLSYEPTVAAAVGAFAVFAVASISDYLDGYLARRYGLITRLGQFLDPTADKLLVGAALWVLVDTRGFPLWAALAIGLREVAVQVLRTRVVQRGGDLPASGAGKTKTALQVAMVSWWLLPWGSIGPVHWLLLAAALVVTVTSGIEYFRRAASAQEAPVPTVASAVGSDNQ